MHIFDFCDKSQYMCNVPSINIYAFDVSGFDSNARKILVKGRSLWCFYQWLYNNVYVDVWLRQQLTARRTLGFVPNNWIRSLWLVVSLQKRDTANSKCHLVSKTKPSVLPSYFTQGRRQVLENLPSLAFNQVFHCLHHLYVTIVLAIPSPWKPF